MEATAKIPSLRTGTVLGSYRIVAPLGGGGMGEIFRAHDAKLDRAVALKILPFEVTHDAERLRRFMQEAKAASFRRCLVKEPDRRYQSMKDLALELHDMVEDWDELALPSGPVGSGSALSGPAPPERAGLRHAVWIGIAAAVAAIAAAAVLFWLRPSGAGSDAERAGFQGMRILPATSNGRVGDAAISPDGRYLVYTRSAAEGTSLWLRQLATGSDAQLLPPQGERRLGTPVFTPDGSYVDYRLSDEQGNYSTLYRMPVLGGAARKIAFDVDTAPGYSPDGGQLVFVRNIGREEQRLIVAELDGRGERVLASRRAEDLRWFDTDARPAWSPDGRSVAVAGADSTGELRGEVVLVDVASGRRGSVRSGPARPASERAVDGRRRR